MSTEKKIDEQSSGNDADETLAAKETDQMDGAIDVEGARKEKKSDRNQPTRRVIVAEDEPLIRLDIVETLRDGGIEVIGEAANGEEAIALATELKPDVVVMDVKMPVMDGITAADQLISQRICGVVMLTAYSQKELVDQAREAGAMAYVIKPFEPYELLPAVEIAISRTQERQSLEKELETLTDQFETRKLVDRAKGLLQSKMGLSEPEAFRWIQKTSMDRRLTMREVAEAVISQLGGRKPRK